MQNPCYILNCYPAWRECMLRKKKILRHFARFTQDTVQWTRIHTFSVNCLNTFTDKVKHPNCNKSNEINICLVSTTILLGKKRRLDSGSESVNTTTSRIINNATPCYYLLTKPTMDNEDVIPCFVSVQTTTSKGINNATSCYNLLTKPTLLYT